MALFILYRTQEHDRNASGMHAALVDAADEPAARLLAQSAAPDGSTRVPATWAADQIAATATLPGGRSVVWLEGDAVSLLGKTRGGSPVS